MKLKQLLKELNELVEKKPEALEMDCVYSIDDEGNSYKPVNWTATVGFYNGGDFLYHKEDLEEIEHELNSVCIN